MTSVEKQGLLMSTKQILTLEPRSDYVTTKRWFIVSCMPQEDQSPNEWMRIIQELDRTASKCLLCRVNNAEKLYKANGEIEGMDTEMKEMEAKAFSI